MPGICSGPFSVKARGLCFQQLFWDKARIPCVMRAQPLARPGQSSCRARGLSPALSTCSHALGSAAGPFSPWPADLSRLAHRRSRLRPAHASLANLARQGLLRHPICLDLKLSLLANWHQRRQTSSTRHHRPASVSTAPRSDLRTDWSVVDLPRYLAAMSDLWRKGLGHNQGLAQGSGWPKPGPMTQWCRRCGSQGDDGCHIGPGNSPSPRAVQGSGLDV